MNEFLRKFKNRGIKITQVHSFLITKFINLLLFTSILYGVWVRCHRRRISLLSQFIEKFMDKHVFNYCDALLKKTGIFQQIKCISSVFQVYFNKFDVLHVHRFDQIPVER